MAYTDSSAGNYTSAAYTDSYTLTHSIPTAYSHSGGLSPAFCSGGGRDPSDSGQLDSSVPKYSVSGSTAPRHADRFWGPDRDLG